MCFTEIGVTSESWVLGGIAEDNKKIINLLCFDFGVAIRYPRLNVIDT